jgi:hypothetical protein
VAVQGVGVLIGCPSFIAGGEWMCDVRLFILVSLVIFLLGCSERITSDQPTVTPVADVASDSKEPHIVFEAMEGFVWDKKSRRFHNERIRTQVLFSHSLGTSFQSLVDDFNSDHMLAAGMELLTKEIRDIGGRDTLLIHASRLKSDHPHYVCTVVYGTSKGCAQITALYPTDTKEEVQTRIERWLLTSRYEVPE